MVYQLPGCFGNQGALEKLLAFVNRHANLAGRLSSWQFVVLKFWEGSLIFKFTLKAISVMPELCAEWLNQTLVGKQAILTDSQ